MKVADMMYLTRDIEEVTEHKDLEYSGETGLKSSRLSLKNCSK
jgi:hypothetical protein